MSLDLMEFQEIIYLKKKKKDGAYVINVDEYSDAGTHWVVLYCKKSDIICFYSFWVEHVTEEIMDFIGNKNLKIEIFRVQASDWFYASRWNFDLIYKHVFSLWFLKNDDIILIYFKNEWK